MPHLFTPRHREKQARPADHELFHGHYCEKMYLLGMELSAELKDLVKAIHCKRNSIATLRKNASRDDANNTLYWQEVLDIRNDDRSLEYIRDRLATVTKQLSIVKLNYQIAFLVSRNFSMKQIADVISWYSFRNKVDCGDPMIAAHIAIEKVKTMEQLQRCGMKLNMNLANTLARIQSTDEVVLDMEVEKTSPISGKFVMTATKSEGEK